MFTGLSTGCFWTHKMLRREFANGSSVGIDAAAIAVANSILFQISSVQLTSFLMTRQDSETCVLCIHN